jgi:hypothetical protein
MGILHVVVKGKGHYQFQKRTIVIGRAIGNDIVIDESWVMLSRHQCRISVEGARVFVSDLKTSQVTMINGKILSVPTPLRPFDVLSFHTARGHSIHILAYLDEAASEPSPSEEELHAVHIEKDFSLRKKSTHLQRLVASSPDVPAEILDELSHSFDLDTLRCIAKNPNARPSFLSRLAPCCAKEILKNPSFLLWLLEDSSLGQFSIDAIVCLLKEEDVPLELLSHLASHPADKIRCAIAKHPRATKEILEQIPIEEGSLVIHHLVSHPNEPRENLFAAARHSNEALREFIVKHSLPAFLVDVLCLDESEEVRWCLASRSMLTTSAQERLSGDPSARVRAEVAKNIHLYEPIAEGLWERLSNDPEESVKLALLEHFEIPHSILQRLCEDSSPAVREKALQK